MSTSAKFSPEAILAREKNRQGQCFKHSKGGGIYRRLFDAPLTTVDVHPDIFTAQDLFEVLHSDDVRPLRCVLGDSRAMVVNDRKPWYGGMGVVYVSCLYHTIWWRPYAEFHGKVLIDGVEVPRFAPYTPPDQPT